MEKSEITKIEMERWFVAKKSDLPFDLNQLKKLKIQQWYISRQPIVRLRETNHYAKSLDSILHNEFILCLKSKAPNIGSLETEILLSQSDFEELKKHATGNQINKFRYIWETTIMGESYKVEIDDFISGNPMISEDEVKIEIEFHSEADYRQFQAPDWFGREVTGNQKYSNVYLSSLI